MFGNHQTILIYLSSTNMQFMMMICMPLTIFNDGKVFAHQLYKWVSFISNILLLNSKSFISMIMFVKNSLYLMAWGQLILLMISLQSKLQVQTKTNKKKNDKKRIFFKPKIKTKVLESMMYIRFKQKKLFFLLNVYAMPGCMDGWMNGCTCFVILIHTLTHITCMYILKINYAQKCLRLAFFFALLLSRSPSILFMFVPVFIACMRMSPSSSSLDGWFLFRCL